MEFRQLRYFVAAADLGNIGLAAQRLNVSQPPVSRQIQALEHELGAQLLVRTPRGVALTEAGRVFHAEAVRILERADLARERSRQAHLGRIGRLDVAFFGTPIYSAVPRSLRAFRQAHPDTQVRLVRMGKGEQAESILNGRIHVGFGRYFADLPGIRVRHLGREALHAALPADDGRPRGAPVTMAELSSRALVLFPAADRPSFADEVISAFGRADLPLATDGFAADATTALAQVAGGSGATLVPASVAALTFPGVTFHPVSDSPMDVPIACIHGEAATSPILARFLETLATAIPEPQDDAAQ